MFQETYHPGRYAELPPANTIKGNFRWRLYAMHRAMDAGIDDVAIGALFGLYDWRFEVMGLVHHAHDLERQFGIGPHTISFPRMQPALGSFVSENSPYLVRDDAFRRLVTVLRLAVPYTGLIVTAGSVLNYGVKLSIMVAHRRMLLRKSESEPIPRKRCRKKIPIRFSLC